jgi:hypothetical protein
MAVEVHGSTGRHRRSLRWMIAQLPLPTRVSGSRSTRTVVELRDVERWHPRQPAPREWTTVTESKHLFSVTVGR